MDTDFLPLRNFQQLELFDFDSLAESKDWEKHNQKQLKVHNIHVYPAKFPSLISDKVFDYMHNQKRKIDTVGDVFCGCGTIAVESKIRGYDFVGYDINPVAILISRAKTNNYSTNKLEYYKAKIIEEYGSEPNLENLYETANERLKYWFYKEQYNSLFRLRNSILKNVHENEYMDLFLCIFSSILKRLSKWLAKSIKPQLDPNKELPDVITIFNKQYIFTLSAINEMNSKKTSNVHLIHDDFLNGRIDKKVDLLITSPPYVTSYEYADLHQLSSLWLGYSNNYTNLRDGSIGSSYNLSNFEVDVELLKGVSKKIIDKFRVNSKHANRAKAVARYFIQIDKTIGLCSQFVKKEGTIVIVIGDTEYHGIKIQNARYISERLIDYGFEIESVVKRRIINKFLGSNRDQLGRFTSDLSRRLIYSHEYIIFGRRT